MSGLYPFSDAGGRFSGFGRDEGCQQGGEDLVEGGKVTEDERDILEMELEGLRFLQRFVNSNKEWRAKKELEGVPAERLWEPMPASSSLSAPADVDGASSSASNAGSFEEDKQLPPVPTACLTFAGHDDESTRRLEQLADSLAQAVKEGVQGHQNGTVSTAELLLIQRLFQKTYSAANDRRFEKLAAQMSSAAKEAAVRH